MNSGRKLQVKNFEAELGRHLVTYSNLNIIREHQYNVIFFFFRIININNVMFLGGGHVQTDGMQKNNLFIYLFILLIYYIMHKQFEL